MEKIGERIETATDPQVVLSIGYCLIISSIFLPFATSFGRLIVRENPGPYSGPQLGVRAAFWSFMHIQEPLAKINGTWVVRSVQWLSFSEYWDWWGPGQGTILPSSILIPTFIVQIIAILLGLITLLKSNTVKQIFPVLITALTLNFLYFVGSQVFNQRYQLASGCPFCPQCQLGSYHIYKIVDSHTKRIVSQRLILTGCEHCLASSATCFDARTICFIESRKKTNSLVISNT